MPSTTDALLPLLAFLASTAGAGWLASALFAAARRRWPCPTAAQWSQAGPLRRAAWQALHAPRGARLTVFALAALVALAASALVAALAGRPVAPALDAALAVIISQLIHAAGLPAGVPSDHDTRPL